MHLSRILYGEAGDTLVEALVAVLISALSLLMLATATGVATRLVTTSKENISIHYDASNTLAENPAAPPAGSPVTQSTGKVRIMSGTNDATGQSDVKLNINESTGGVKIISYEVMT